MQLRFDWDERKARINKRKHGVNFEEAQTVFRDELIFTSRDTDHSEREDRYQTVGLSSQKRLLMVVHADTEGPDYVMIRIISCRKATRAEQKKYEET